MEWGKLSLQYALESIPISKRMSALRIDINPEHPMAVKAPGYT